MERNHPLIQKTYTLTVKTANNSLDQITFSKFIIIL